MADALLSLVSPAVAVALIAVVGAYMTARAAFADVTLKRRLDTAQRFAELAEVANNATGSRGLYEQIAALHLLATFRRDEEHWRPAARAVLTVVAQRADTAKILGSTAVVNAANDALALLPGESRAKKN